MDSKLFSVAGKVALITGSAKGNGAAISSGLASHGASVIGWDVVEPSSSLPKVDHQRCDITDTAAVSKSLDYIVSKYKKIDILINNAGVTKPHDFLSYPDPFWDQTYLVNLKAPFYLMKKVGSLMKKNKGGSIINVTSINAEQAFPNNPAYIAFKGALKQLSKSAALDLGSHGIRVNNIGPGYFRTDMTRKSWADPERREQLSQKTIMGRWGEPSDLVGVVIFLSSGASSYITGQDIYVDGGWLTKGL